MLEQVRETSGQLEAYKGLISTQNIAPLAKTRNSACEAWLDETSAHFTHLQEQHHGKPVEQHPFSMFMQIQHSTVIAETANQLGHNVVSNDEEPEQTEAALKAADEDFATGQMAHLKKMIKERGDTNKSLRQAITKGEKAKNKQEEDEDKQRKAAEDEAKKKLTLAEPVVLSQAQKNRARRRLGFGMST